MNELDWLFSGILLISTLVGVFRGMSREIFALAGWIVAFFMSMYFSANVAEMIPLQSVGPMIKTLIAVILIVTICVFISGLLGKIFHSILSTISAGMEDRLLGCLFGFFRGLIVVGFLIYVGGATQFIASQVWWKNSEMVPWFEKGIVWCSPYLPNAILNLRKD